MASFTDQIHGFSPYVKTLPVDAYTKVGMFKQQQFEEGVQTIQKYVDSVSGLPIDQQATKQYVQAKLGQVQKGMGENISGDFSDQRLVNQIGGAISSIVSDPIVSNGMASTAAYRKGLADMEVDRKAGKGSTSNEYVFGKAASQWLNNADPSTQFNSTYTPYRDVQKKILDTVKAIDPSSSLTQLPYKRNADGTPELDATGHPQVDETMLEISTSGKSRDKVKAALYTALDEGDMNQLAIDGVYHYRDKTPQDMAGIVVDNLNSRKEFLEKALADQNAQLLLNVNDSDHSKTTSDNIASIKKSLENLDKEYESAKNGLQNNPEGFKGMFYANNFIEQSANAFSSINSSYKVIDNPSRKQMNWQEDFNQKAEKAKTDLEHWELEYKQKGEENDAKAGKGNSLIGGKTNLPIPEAPKVTESSWLTDIKSKEDALATLKSDALSKFYPGMDPKDAEVQLNEARSSWIAGKNPASLLSEYFKNEADLQRDVQNKNQRLIEIKAAADQKFPGISGGLLTEKAKGGTIRVYDPTNKINGTYTLSKDDIVDIAILNTAESSKEKDKSLEADEARKRLVTKFGFNIATAVNAESFNNIQNYKSFGLDETTQNVKDLGVLKRHDFIRDELTKVSKVGVPSAENLLTGNELARNKVAGFVNNVLTGIENQRGSVGTAALNFDLGEARKLNDPSKTSTTYSTGQDSQGNWYIILSDPKNKTPQYIPVSAEDLMGNLGDHFNQPFKNVQATLALTGDRTTNVLGQGASSAYFKRHDFPNLNDPQNPSPYGVAADVESFNGMYQLVLYVHNNKDPKDTWTTIRPPRVFSSGMELINAQRKIGNQTIYDLLNQKPPQEWQ